MKECVNLGISKLLCTWIILAALLASGCSGKKAAPEKLAPRVEDMSSGQVQVTITADPPKVELHKDILLTIKTVAQSDTEVTLPPLDDRLTGFILSGVLDDEPVIADGKTTLQRRLRLTPILADEYRIGPMAISYADKRKNPPITGWFATRPIVFERIAPVEHSPGKDIEVVMKPVWIYPSFKTVALYTLLVISLVALCFLGWKLAKRIHRHIKLMRMSPRERALFELSELLSKDLTAKNMIKEFYLELTMIVRRYIERQHLIRAPEQTTEEFLLAVSKDSRFSHEVVRRLRSFLEAADLVKFAADHPTGEEISGATMTAKEYIEKDAPVERTVEKG
jgi:hypothetical protein